MLGIPELTVELRNLQARADYHLPRLVDGMLKVSGSIDELVKEWRATGDPDFSQLVVQLSSLNAKGDQIKELISLLKSWRKREDVDVKGLVKKLLDKAKGAADA